MEEGPETVSHQPGDSIPRPASTSEAEAAVSQLLGMNGINETNGAGDSSQDHSAGDAPPAPQEAQPQPQPQSQPQQQPQPHPQPAAYNGATHAAATSGNGQAMTPMSCQNCSTSITPLWRRDEYGSVLCNACGLFLKLHGRPRPISLKTDVIKSRNRVKTMRPDAAGKKKTATPQGNQAARRQSGNANADGNNDSPISRTGTPSMYNQALSSFMVDDPYSSTNFGANGDGSGSPMNGDTPQTHEQLIATNSSLKTRVRELELINELFRGRLSQLEQQEAAARRGHEVAGVEQTQLRSQLEATQESETQLRTQLDDSHRRENSLKRRLDDLELELKELKDSAEGNSDRPNKRSRVQSAESAKDEAAPQTEEPAEKQTESADAAEPEAVAAEAS